MFEKARLQLDEWKEKWKRADFIRVIVSICVYFFYLAYKTTVVNEQFRVIDGILIAVTLAYLFFFIAAYLVGMKGNTKRIGRVSYKIVKFLMLVVSGAMSVFGIMTASAQPDFLTVLFAVLMPLNVLLQIVIDVAVFILSRKITAATLQVKNAYNEIKQPIIQLKNAFFPSQKQEDKWKDYREIEEDDGKIQ